jgi:phospholipid N-methyltransferase
MGTLTYVKNFVSDRYIASITPTSAFGVRRVCGMIDFRRCGVIVEFGPGTGVFTRHLLENMGPASKVVLIERNPNFCETLKSTFRDPRAVILNDCASNVLATLDSLGIPCADYVLSGIPFSFLPIIMRDRILRNTHQALRGGGKFLAYQTFYQANNHLKVHLDRIFRSVRVYYEIMNLPPLRIYEALKLAKAGPGTDTIANSAERAAP